MTDNRWLSDQHWRRESHQSRGEQTQTALLDATESLIIEQGTEGTSIADIARRAGCSVGTVYHHFKDKQALFFALFHRMTKAYAAATREAADPARWQGASVHDLVRGYITFLLPRDGQVASSKAAAALVLAAHPELRSHIAELQGEGRRALAGLILARREQIGHPSPDRAVAFFVDQLGAMLQARTDPIQRKAAIQAADDATFIAEALALADSYLQLKSLD